MKSTWEFAIKGLKKTVITAKLIIAAFLFFMPQHGKGFALLGPYEDWMQFANGFRYPNDIGGPMELGNEYRWNVPLLTYGFDQSFLDYFGSNGVVAVEQAFQILNDLPPASSINLADYSMNIRQFNEYSGFPEPRTLFDLKTATLGLMLEQLGLAQPTRSVFILRQFDPILTTHSTEPEWLQLPEGTIAQLIFERNFDPETLLTSRFVNDSQFTGQMYYGNLGFIYADIFEQVIDPTKPWVPAIADQGEIGSYSAGFSSSFFTGLSADDAGGLRYLLHTNNVNYENLLPDVHGATNQIYVNAAMRPGVNKITFLRQQFDLLSQQWIRVTNQFTDTYLTNAQPVQQTLERVVVQPDFLFSAGDTGVGSERISYFLRTGTTNWQNNGSPGAPGPGVIRPPIRFTFNRFPTLFLTFDFPGSFRSDPFVSIHWASFDETTNAPVVYPVETFQETNSFSVRFKILPDTFEWRPNIPAGGTALLQTSTNLTSWTTLDTVTNAGGVFEWYHQRSVSQRQRFFRVVPQ